MRGKRTLALGTFSLACLVTVFAGRWGMSLFTTSEFVHFSMNFPDSAHEQLPSRQRPGPWSLVPEEEWRAYPRGGLLAWGRENEITVDLGRRGMLKQIFDSSKLLMSSHWIRNIGVRPYRIRVELFLCDMPQTRVTFEKHWDDTKLETTRNISPGGTFNLDWIVTLTPDWKKRSNLCRGNLNITDADSGDRLTALPVRIINSAALRGSDK